ncbi:NUDIX domain-containing protein [Cellulomonas shaoxiangyii]|uniref:NUDIX domain-containing protein n=1 Tax=Cellulomonas shaoxiangyii TaxID=2566013 RepID=A0A4P7SKK5_9CELL|nr:NUDIX domain-containing protein [Cellulomonas shaoxiangyii]QCB94829.1 NUDIX domain-containing protein [Cellulomonas shaoxiangyii]TGY86559.1 NUDIX domain-containing protein [Cellulomonas shaoxiangyii]
MPVTSAGVLLHHAGPAPRVLLAHMGGPFWARKDARAWTVPKGLVERGEDVVTAALREFREEVGLPAPDLPTVELGAFRYASGKVVVVLAIEVPAGLVGSPDDPASDDLATRPGVSTIDMEWPPRSGRRATFPEVDRAAWCGLDDARERLVAGQVPAIDALVARGAGA